MSVRWRPSCWTHSEPLLKIRHRTLQHFLRHSCDFLTNGKFQLFDNARSVRVRSTLQVSPQKKKKSHIDRSGEHGGQETSLKWEITCWGNCSMANTRCSAFQCAMATETALSELSAGSHPTSSTAPLQSTSHLKNMRFPCPTLYIYTYIYIYMHICCLLSHYYVRLINGDSSVSLRLLVP